MEARIYRPALLAACLLSLGAGYRTENFIVSAPTQQLAKEIGDEAERFRSELAIEWLGKELPPWSGPCPITAQVSPQLGAGGATSFMFDRGRPFGWRMSIQGSRERVLDSVLPHEITHTIFATHFGRPLPRWADEGACTTVEHDSEKTKQQRNLIVFLTTERGIPFNHMFAMTEYPDDILPLYSQGYSVARFLIAQGGKRKYVDYVGEGMRTNNWTATTDKYYGMKSLSELQLTWLDWVRRGSPPLTDSPQLAATSAAGQAGQVAQASHPAPAASPGIAVDQRQLASDATEQPKRSWYARDVSSDASAPANQLANDGLQFHRPDAPSAGYPAGNVPGQQAGHVIEQQHARPQAAQQPRQTILEWSRPGPGNQAGPQAGAWLPGSARQLNTAIREQPPQGGYPTMAAGGTVRRKVSATAD